MCFSGQGFHIDKHILCSFQMVLETAKYSDPKLSLVFLIEVFLIKKRAYKVNLQMRKNIQWILSSLSYDYDMRYQLMSLVYIYICYSNRRMKECIFEICLFYYISFNWNILVFGITAVTHQLNLRHVQKPFIILEVVNYSVINYWWGLYRNV